MASFQWSQRSNPMTSSEVEGFTFRDQDETGDGEKVSTFVGLALASDENAAMTVLENPATKSYWIGQINDAPIKGIKESTLNKDTDYVTLQIRREPGGTLNKL